MNGIPYGQRVKPYIRVACVPSAFDGIAGIRNQIEVTLWSMGHCRYPSGQPVPLPDGCLFSLSIAIEGPLTFSPWIRFELIIWKRDPGFVPILGWSRENAPHAPTLLLMESDTGASTEMFR